MKNEIMLMHSILKSKVLRKPYRLNFIVTSKCNSRCITCNIWKFYRNEPGKLKSELSLEEIDKIFLKLPKTVVWVSLTGGEPFLRQDFAKIILSAMKNIENLKIISIPSNGLATDSIINTVKKIMETKNNLRIIITFSIDGPKEIHNKIRGLDSYDKVWNTYFKLKDLTKNDKRFQIGIETTISKENMHFLEKYLESIIQKHSPHLTLTIAHNASLYKNERGGDLSPKNIEEVKKITGVLMRNKKLFSPQDIIERIYLKNIMRYLKNPKKRVIPCAAFNASFSINQEGYILPCLMWGERVGDLRGNDYDSLKILNSKKAREIKKLIKNEKCPNCWTPCEAYQSIIWNPIRAMF
jgi:MoaA/NifB/PqqE/SkfB family radical SAM enzyme